MLRKFELLIYFWQNFKTTHKQMKKQLQRIASTLLLIGVLTSSYGQSTIEHKGFEGKDLSSSKLSKSSLKQKADYSDWEYPVGAILQLTPLDRSVGILFPDSVVKIVDGAGEENFLFTHSVGAAFTPNDENLALNGDNIILSRYNQYTVDSLELPYLYVRHVDSTKDIDLFELLEALDSFSQTSTLSDSALLDSIVSSNYFPSIEVVDTLIVQYFKSDNLLARTQGTDIYMRPRNWDRNVLGSTNTAFEVKIPLTASDSTPKPVEGWFTDIMTLGLPDDFNIDSDAATEALQFTNAFGFSVAFKPMLSYEFGDTIESLNGDIIENKLNYFGISQYTNSSIDVPQETYVNNSWRVTSKLLYGQADNGWTVAIPGLAFVRPFYLNYALLISSTTLTTSDIDNNITFGVYPNPVSRNEMLMADFNLVNASEVSIAIYDLLGNKVKDVVNGYYPSGEHTLDLNISDLSAGMYLYSVQAGNSVTSKKITITD